LLDSWMMGAADAVGRWVLLVLLRCVATLEYCARLLASWVLSAAIAAEVRRYAGVLREAVGLLGIGYCAKLLSC
jgi:hypothetical protein